MKENLIKGWKLARYGLNFKLQLVFMIVFFVLGTVATIETENTIGVLDSGTVFLLCTAMFPAQMLLSLDITELAQTSPYKKKIQTDMPALITVAGTYLMFIWNLILLAVSCGIRGISYADMSWRILLVGIWAVIILLFNGFCYKHFILSLVALYMVAFGGGFAVGIGQMVGKIGNISLNPVLSILISTVLILIGGALEYALTLLFYKQPLSKMAFGALAKKNL